MKTLQNGIFLLIVVCLLMPLSSKAQDLNQELPALINSGDFLSLLQRYETAKDSLEQDNVVRILSEAFIQSAFNRPEDASNTCLHLISNYQEDLGLQSIMNLLGLMAENMRYMGNYQTASYYIESLLEQTADFPGSDSLNRVKLANQIPLRAFGDSYKPEILRPNKDSEVPLLSGEGAVKDLLHIPVVINGKEIPFILDTGADGFATNFVHEDFAREHGIRILDDSVKIGGMVASAYARLGTLERMQIGDIVYRNVAFMIAPSTDTLATYMNAILGSAFMKAVGEIQIYPQENRIVFPIRHTPAPKYAPNMMITSGQPYLETYVTDERMLLHFDTGAGISLDNNYYEKYREDIEATGRYRAEGGLGGFGGIKKIPQYYIPNVDFRIGDASKKIEEVTVWTMPTNVYNTWPGGSLGSDFVRMFNKVTINFHKMFVAVE